MEQNRNHSRPPGYLPNVFMWFENSIKTIKMDRYNVLRFLITLPLKKSTHTHAFTFTSMGLCNEIVRKGFAPFWSPFSAFRTWCNATTTLYRFPFHLFNGFRYAVWPRSYLLYNRIAPHHILSPFQLCIISFFCIFGERRHLSNRVHSYSIYNIYRLCLNSAYTVLHQPHWAGPSSLWLYKKFTEYIEHETKLSRIGRQSFRVSFRF